MKLKLIDVIDLGTDYYETGTCEFCMDLELYGDSIYVFKDEKGKEHKCNSLMPLGWGDYEELDLGINVIDFADWVARTEFDDDLFKEDNYYPLYVIISKFREELEEEEE